MTLLPYTLPQWLPADPTCDLCELRESPHPRGIRSAKVASSLPDEAPVLVVIAQNPGLNECLQGVPLVGPVGQLFHEMYLKIPKLPSIAHIYLMNAYRCYTPTTQTVRKSWITACSNHSLIDLSQIRAHHPRSSLYILATGAHSTTLLHKLNPNAPPNMSSAWHQQGKVLELAGTSWSCFWTYHPGAINRDRNLAINVANHLTLLVATITKSRNPITPIRRIVPQSIKRSS